jgi:NAD(P)H dehydrogenase (quinone)
MSLDAQKRAPRHLVVLGHPKPGSFNHLIAETYRDAATSCGHDVVLRDLHALDFRAWGAGSEQCQNEVEFVTWADVLVFVYPIWFGLPPAIIKGYVDRVLGATFDIDLLKQNQAPENLVGMHFLSLSSSASTKVWLGEHGQWISLRQGFDAYLSQLFHFASNEHVHFGGMVAGTSAQTVEQHLETTRQAARETCSRIGSERHRDAAKAALMRFRSRAVEQEQTA